MPTRQLSPKAGVLQGFGLDWLFDATSTPNWLKSRGKFGRDIPLNSSWVIKPSAVGTKGLHCVTTITASTRINLGLTASTLGLNSTSARRTFIVAGYMDSGNYTGSGNTVWLSAGSTTGAGYFLLGRNPFGNPSGFFASYFGPDIFPNSNLPCIFVFVLSYDGAGNHRYTLVQANAAGRILSTDSNTASGGGNTATTDLFPMGIGYRQDGSWTWPGGSTAALFYVGGGRRNLSQLEQLALARRVLGSITPQTVRYPAGSVSGGTTWTITPSGQVLFTGGTALLRTKRLSTGGSISLSGTSGFQRTRKLNNSGSVTYSGSSAISTTSSTTYTMSPSGSMTLSGSVPQLHSKVYLPSGTLVFSGAVPQIKTNVVSASGTITYTGVVSMVYVPFGTPSVTSRLSLTGVGA